MTRGTRAGITFRFFEMNRMKIARTMLDCKFDILTIAKLTGLTEEEIIAL